MIKIEIITIIIIIMIVIIIIIIIIIITTTTTTIIKIYMAQIPCEYVQMHVTNKYDRN